MNEDVAIYWRKDEACAELKGILAEPVLSVASSFCASPCLRIVVPKNMEEICGL